MGRITLQLRLVRHLPNSIRSNHDRESLLDSFENHQVIEVGFTSPPPAALRFQTAHYLPVIWTPT